MNVMHMNQQDPQCNFVVTTASSNYDHSNDLNPLPLPLVHMLMFHFSLMILQGN